MAEAVNAAVRKTARTRRIPPGATCAQCGYGDARALEAWGAQWRCYNCANAARGRPVVEDHHVLGKDTDALTVPVDGNVHREISELERDVDAEIREMAPNDPLAWIIRVLWSVYNFLRGMLTHLARAIAWLTRLLHALRERFGKAWPTDLGLDGLW